MRPRICLYVVGEPPPAVASAHGRFADWFARLASAAPVDLAPVDGADGLIPERLDAYDAFVITGSPASLTAPEPWMEAAVELVRHAYAERRPLLGVCFGHQLVGAAFGGAVVNNPRGWEVSTCAVELTETGRRDPLFDGLPDRIDVNFSHRDIIDETTLSPMNGVEVLAGNPTCAVQAVAAGPHVRAVQFHPEFTASIISSYVRTRADDLAAAARDFDTPDFHPDAALDRAADCPAGERVFDNFLRHFVLSASVSR